MLCFVDESGDTGLKLGKGSSRYFTVTVVLFRDNEEARMCDRRIELLKHELGVPERFEFHYDGASSRFKKTFFAAVMRYDFLYASITIDKERLYGEAFSHKESFYKYVCRLVFESIAPHLEQAIVIIDGQGSQKFRSELKAYLKSSIQHNRAPCIKDVRLQDSHRNNLLQLADMICGAIAESLKSHAQSQKNRGYVIARELSWEIWPPLGTG
jgi:hypothetical protein